MLLLIAGFIWSSPGSCSSTLTIRIGIWMGNFSSGINIPGTLLPNYYPAGEGIGAGEVLGMVAVFGV